MNIRHRSRCGYALIELLCAVALLGTFALIATRLFNSAFKVMWQNGQATEVPMRFDSAIATLRSDMASSESVEFADSNSIVIRKAADKIVHWRTDGIHTVSRKDSDIGRNWDIGQGIEFQKEGTILLIHPKASIDGLADIAIAPGERK